jgi:hypothetical protein
LPDEFFGGGEASYLYSYIGSNLETFFILILFLGIILSPGEDVSISEVLGLVESIYYPDLTGDTGLSPLD